MHQNEAATSRQDSFPTAAVISKSARGRLENVAQAGASRAGDTSSVAAVVDMSDETRPGVTARGDVGILSHLQA